MLRRRQSERKLQSVIATLVVLFSMLFFSPLLFLDSADLACAQDIEKSTISYLAIIDIVQNYKATIRLINTEDKTTAVELTAYEKSGMSLGTVTSISELEPGETRTLDAKALPFRTASLIIEADAIIDASIMLEQGGRESEPLAAVKELSREVYFPTIGPDSTFGGSLILLNPNNNFAAVEVAAIDSNGYVIARRTLSIISSMQRIFICLADIFDKVVLEQIQKIAVISDKDIVVMHLIDHTLLNAEGLSSSNLRSSTLDNETVPGFTSELISSQAVGFSYPETEIQDFSSASPYATYENAFYNPRCLSGQDCDLRGQCTWYVYGRTIELVRKGNLPTSVETQMKDAFWGPNNRHAKYWPSFLKDRFLDGTVPKKGAIAVWTSCSDLGHVGFVENVYGTEYLISEFNYPWPDYKLKYHTRPVSTSADICGNKPIFFYLDAGGTTPANNPPMAEAAVSKSLSGPYYGYATPLTVTKGQAVSLYFFADKDVNGDGKASLDPDGWTNADNGVSSGGKCEWNTDLNQGSPSFEKVISSPSSPGACNILSASSYTFNDAPGTYEYQILRITDKKGAQSNVSMIRITVVDTASGTPTLLIDSGSSSTKAQGGTFSLTGTKYTPNGTVTRYVNGTAISSITATSSGTISWTWPTDCNTATGTYTVYAKDNTTGKNSNIVTEIVTASSSCTAPQYEGWLDAADCSSIRGWAWNKNLPTMPINVDIYDGSAKIATVAADIFRQDLLNAGKGNGYHGFNFTTPASLKNGVSHSISVRYSGTIVNLSGSPKSLTCGASPTLLIDGGTSSTKAQGGTFNFTGSNYAPNGAVSRYLKKPDGSTQTLANVIANSSGGVSWSYPSVCADTPGMYSVQAKDNATGKYSNWVTEVITASSSCSPPNTPSYLYQYKSDGVTSIVSGGTTNQSTVVLKGKISDPNGKTVKLQVELRRLDEFGGSFTGTHTQESGFLASGSTASITVTGLISGNYHWRARTVNSHGTASSWISAGANSDSVADFIVSVNATPCISAVSSTQWKGEYFNNKTLYGSPSLVRDDGNGNLNFDWGSGSPGSACGIGSDNFSVRWKRTVYFNSGTYRFTVTSDDGFRLYVDGFLKLDKWFDQISTAYTVDIALASGNHIIKMEYYENSASAVAKLSWQSVNATPTLLIDGGTSSTKVQGGTFNFSGSNYTPNSSVNRYLKKPDGSTMTLANVTANSSGGVSWSYQSVCADTPGTYSLQARDSATGKYSNWVTEVITASSSCTIPTLLINGGSSSTKSQGGTFYLAGSNFTANGSVTRYLKQPNGTTVTLSPTLYANSSGKISWSFTSSCSTEPGTYSLWVKDNATGKVSNSVTEIVTRNSNCSPTLSINGETSSTKAQGGTFTCTGFNYTPNGSTTRYLKQPNGTTLILTPTLYANGSGKISWSFTSSCANAPGTYYIWVKDNSTGKTSNTVTEIITHSSSCP
jgi:hypothetical protein